METNPNAMLSTRKDSIFTNVALTDDGDVWWEGMTETPPEHLIDWQGRDWTPDMGRPSSHPNSRFTAPITNCPCVDSDWENPNGVPISAFIFGGRRDTDVPLVFQSFNWTHGVYLGATMGSQKTAAAEGKAGEIRRDPMAMLPFIGYNMGDYLRHYIKVGNRLLHPPRIFHVNWFRRNPDGKFLWPGFGDNMRVLKWIIDRSSGHNVGMETALGWMPVYENMDWSGMEFTEEEFDEVMSFNKDRWTDLALEHEKLFIELHSHIPKDMVYERELLKCRLLG